MLNWSRFDSGPVGPSEAFEAFAAQLFERWLRREHGSDLTTYILQGAGGDGGVEAYATLPDGDVVGLQAKWFLGNVTDSRIRQICGSLDSAMKRYPRLRQYVVALPRNLTKGTMGKGGKLRKGGVERWERFIAEVAGAHPMLKVTRWDEAGLIEQLSCPGNRELKALWFDGELTFGAIDTAWMKTKMRLGARYLPRLHAVGQIETTLAKDLWSSGVVEGALSQLIEIQGSLSGASSDLAAFTQLTDGQRPSELEATLPRAATELSSLQKHAALLHGVLSTGPKRLSAQRPSAIALQELSECLESFKNGKSGTHTAELAEQALHSAQSSFEAIEQVHIWLHDSFFPRVLRGTAGCGKTHASAKAVADRIGQRSPAVMMLAKECNPTLGAGAILQDALDLPGWPLGRILDGLEALTILEVSRSSTEREGTTGYSRCLLLIDGLEESVDSLKWEGVLSDLTVELVCRPRIHLVVTARPEYLKQVELPCELSVAFIEQDGDVDLPRLFREYVRHFNVAVDSVPWLGWALRTPLEVRLFAEEFQGRSVSADDGASANLLTLFRRKNDRLEREARQRAGNSAWTAHLGLVPVVLETISKLLSLSASTRVPEGDIIQAASAVDPEFTAQRVRGVLSLLHEHGLVDRWVPPAHGLQPSQPKYTLSTRHLSDFVLASQLTPETLERLRGATEGAVTFPSALRSRDDAAVLFAAQLAEQGHFVADVTWADPPENLRLIHAASMTLLPATVTAARIEEIADWLVESTAVNRGMLRRLTIPLSRIPNHPLGPRLLDRALRKLPLAKRDQIWSVPEDLDGPGPWRCCFDKILDQFELSERVDKWDGLPLVAAWTCTSVVERRRTRAREMLAVWGASNLADMVALMAHMSNVDDPQIVDDVVVAALGAAVGAPIGNSALRDLARLVDKLFFAEDASAWTPSIPVRVGARGVVERAALIFPGEFDDELARARPVGSPGTELEFAL